MPRLSQDDGPFAIIMKMLAAQIGTRARNGNSDDWALRHLRGSITTHLLAGGGKSQKEN
jgi:hypothetical protein